jgi:DNA uptake protein ComE-like DNA-binding protein
MNFKQLIRDYFTFSRSERRGVIILVILIFLFAVVNKFIFYFEKPGKIDVVLLDSARHKLGAFNDSVNQQIFTHRLFRFDPNTIDSMALDSLDLPYSVKQNILRFRNKGGRFYKSSDLKRIYGVTDNIFTSIKPYLIFAPETKEPSSEPELFVFDPNTATDIDFRRLGFSDKLIGTIRKYQDKGGFFRSKADFFKIYGLSESQKQRLNDLVVIEIAEKQKPAVNKPNDEIMIELNGADSIQLKQLPGIGDKLSKRIIKYRDLLGGFYSVSQLKEVYGLTDATLKLISEKVMVDDKKIKKMDMNFADINELSIHPYLKKNLAGKIIKFRSKNGSIRDLSVLRDSMILNIEEYTRLKPYF